MSAAQHAGSGAEHLDAVWIPSAVRLYSLVAACMQHDAPVLLVGKKGVGDAVDSFNLNATFFEARGAAVRGAEPGVRGRAESFREDVPCR